MFYMEKQNVDEFITMKWWWKEMRTTPLTLILFLYSKFCSWALSHLWSRCRVSSLRRNSAFSRNFLWLTVIIGDYMKIIKIKCGRKLLCSLFKKMRHWLDSFTSLLLLFHDMIIKLTLLHEFSTLFHIVEIKLELETIKCEKLFILSFLFTELHTE